MQLHLFVLFLSSCPLNFSKAQSIRTFIKTLAGKQNLLSFFSSLRTHLHHFFPLKLCHNFFFFPPPSSASTIGRACINLMLPGSGRARSTNDGGSSLNGLIRPKLSPERLVTAAPSWPLHFTSRVWRLWDRNHPSSLQKQLEVISQVYAANDSSWSCDDVKIWIYNPMSAKIMTPVLHLWLSLPVQLFGERF